MTAMTYRPRIGITTSYENDRQLISATYLKAIEQAGGLPLIVPILETAEAVADFAGLLDGLLMTGGPAVTEGMIGNLPPDLEATDPTRIRMDKAILAAMNTQHSPLLGICYGMQFINAQSGGTIYADVQAQKPGTIAHSSGRGGTNHQIHIEPVSHLGKILGTEELSVNTYHIQAIAEVGAGLRVAAYGEDGVIEAVESLDGRVLGVQFHPERMLDRAKPIFEDFIARCRAYQLDKTK